MEKLAVYMMAMDKRSEAKQLFEEVLEERKKNLTDSHSDILRINVAVSFFSRKYNDGSDIYVKQKEILDGLDRSDDSFILNCFQIALSFRFLGRSSEASQLLQELLEIQAKTLEAIHPLDVLILIEIGNHSLIPVDKAVEQNEKLSRRHKTMSDKEFVLYSLLKLRIASSCLDKLCYNQSNLYEGKTLLEEFINEYAERFGKSDSDRLCIIFSTAKCLVKERTLQQYKLRDARNMFEKVVKVKAKELLKKNFDSIDMKLGIDDILICLNDFSEDKDFLENLAGNVKHVFGDGVPLS